MAENVSNENRLLAALADPIWLIIALIPLLGWLAVILSALILALIWLILSIYYAVQAYQGKTFTIPIVSDFAKIKHSL